MGEKKALISKSRNLNLDLIRCVAVFCVLGNHLFMYVPFYEELFTGSFMWVLTVVRTSIMVCVPLFVLLTGYLCCQREGDRSYFKKLIPVLLTYLLASVFTIVVRLYWGEAITLSEAILGILNTSNGIVGYSWYIEMYIGLFLLIPYLNILYRGVGGKKQKQILILVMVTLTMIPSLLNSHDLTSFATFFQSGLPEKRHSIFPGWWGFLWPVTYYFIGAYIREYDIPIPKWKNAIGLIGWVILLGSFIYYRSYGGYLLYSPQESWGAYYIMIHSILLFLLLLHLDLSKVPQWIGKILERVSELSLGIYLCSYITDQYLYYKFLSQISSTRHKQLLAPVLMMISFLLAALASQLIQWIMAAPKWAKKHIH